MGSPEPLGSPAAGVAGPAPRCLVFADGDDWIVFGPRSLLALRVNAAAAQRFRDLPDPGPPRPAPRPEPGDGWLPPSCVTIACGNRCAQRCVYCYGAPVHDSRAVIEPQFVAAALALAARAAAVRAEPLRVIFHGVGEPTQAWRRFAECVELAHAVPRRHGVAARLDLCTGGQLSPARAAWVAERFDGVQVSIDGPADVQNRQRPRRDGRDALSAPLRLARAASAAGRRVCVKATVTAATVERMVEIVELVAREVGPVRLDLGMAFTPRWVRPEEAASPPWPAFVAGFAAALDRGAALGVRVAHPSVSWDTLAGEHGGAAAPHFCLAPPDIVTAFFDVPREGAAPPGLGAYGRWDRARGTIVFDHEKRRRLEAEQAPAVCLECACAAACLGPGGVKGRMPDESAPLGAVCQARLGVLRELLRRAVPRPERARGERGEAQP